MNIVEIVDSWLATISGKLGIGAGRLNSAGEAVIRSVVAGTEIDLRVVVFERQGIVAMAVPLGRISESGLREDFFAGLLAANLYGLVTEGLALSFSPGDSTICLGYNMIGEAPSLSYDSFEFAFVKLMTISQQWKIKFRELLSA